MSRVVELLCSRRVPQVAVLALMSIGFAGCSADMSTRLSQNHFSNPFASQPEATGSVPAARRRAPRTAAICAAASAISVRGVAAADRGAAVLSGRQQRRVRRRARAWPPMRRPAAADSKPPAAWRRVRSRRARPAQGGTTIIVGTSDTLEILARRYNVSSAAILQANGYKGPRALSPGQQLIIPHPTAAGCRACAGFRRAGQQAGCRWQRPRRRRPCRQSRRHLAQHRPPQPCFGGRTRQGQ